MKQTTVTVNGQKTTCKPNTVLSELVGGERPCGGHGKCGKCKVIAAGALSAPEATERSLLSEAELAAGVRLACLTYVLGDCEVKTILTDHRDRILTHGDLPDADVDPCFSHYGVAVDLGTTTVAARLYDRHGRLLAEQTCLNPQRQWGADVVSRIEAALNGSAGVLADAVRTALNDVFVRLAAIAAIETTQIDGVVVTGNTVMLSLLAGVSVEPFSHAPFAVELLFGETMTAHSLGLHVLSNETSVYLPPCMSAFVGADTTCAILACSLCETETALLADIGTNGEMALWHDGRLTVCSTAAGPAFEGVGISMGMRGEDGAIDTVTIVNGQPTAHVIGEKTPAGICASGLVDAVACLLDLELLDESGYLQDDPAVIRDTVVLTQQDVRMFQLAKSAIGAGLLTLMDHTKVTAADIQTLYIAGGFGTYLNTKSAARVGLLPSALALKSKAIGNAALAGASLLLLNAESRTKAKAVADDAELLELSTNAVFCDRYIAGMALKPCKE